MLKKSYKWLILFFSVVSLFFLFTYTYYLNNVTIYISNLSRYQPKLETKIFIDGKLIYNDNIVQNLQGDFTAFKRIWLKEKKDVILKVIIKEKLEKTEKFIVSNDTKVFVTLGSENFDIVSEDDIVINILHNRESGPCPKTFFNRVLQNH